MTNAGGRLCAEGQDGEPLLPGRCYVAPGGWHMLAVREGASVVLRLNQEAPENFCRPAVDPMLRSIAGVYGTAVAAIILTGMGADGSKGCEAVAHAVSALLVDRLKAGRDRRPMYTKPMINDAAGARGAAR